MLRWLKTAGAFVVALVILFEEWGWEPLQALLERIGRLPLLRQLERWIARLPPYGALAVFAVPALGLLPVKLAALWLIGRGHAGLGLAVIVLAKLAGTAILARLFALTQRQLMTLAWFATLYARWHAWKTALLQAVRATRAWQEVVALKRRAAAWFRR